MGNTDIAIAKIDDQSLKMPEPITVQRMFLMNEKDVQRFEQTHAHCFIEVSTDNASQSIQRQAPRFQRGDSLFWIRFSSFLAPFA